MTLLDALGVAARLSPRGFVSVFGFAFSFFLKKLNLFYFILFYFKRSADRQKKIGISNHMAKMMSMG